MLSMIDSPLVVASQQLQVRIRRPKVGKLACQAQGMRIFTQGVNIRSPYY